MKAKRLFSVALMLIALCSIASAQKRLEVQLKDRTIMTFGVDELNYMEFVESPGEGELDGVWYLGWQVSTSASNKKGQQTVSFSSNRMKWVTSAVEDIYTLTYSEAGAVPGSTFEALKVGSTRPATYTIFNMEDSLLTLKKSSTRYYLYRSKEAATKARSISGYLSRQQCATGEAVWNAGIKDGNTHYSSSPMGSHIGKYAAATDADRAWLADPNNQPDTAYHEIHGKRFIAKTITLYPMNNATPIPADVNQHGIGDCCMCAVFASFAYIYPEWIKTLIEQDGNNYTVHMFDPKGNPIDVVVDNKIICNSDGGVFQVCGKNDKYDWATILEKALMKWESRFKCNRIGGIGTEHAAPPFTGNGDSWRFDWGDKMYNSEYPLLVDYAIGTLGMISVGGFHESGVMMGQLETVTGHAFTVMYADEGADYAFVMRNPWGNEPNGSSYSNRTDGKLKIPFDHSKLRLVDFRFVYPGAQMAQYKKQNMGGYTPPKFVATYGDMNPSEEMLRMYNVKNYVPVYPKADDAFEPGFEVTK